MTQKILLVGANLRAMFFVARKLHEQKYIVDLIGNENIPFEKSIYINAYFFIQKSKGEKFFLEQLIKVISQNKYNYLIPINDHGVLICKDNFTELNKYSTILTSNPSSLEYSYNKYNLSQICKNHELGNLNTLFIENKEQLIKKASDISNYPIIAKACNSKKIIQDNLESFTVFKAYSYNDLLNRFCNEDEFPILIQDFIQGEEYGFNFIAQQGEIQSYYIDTPYISTFGTESIARQIVQIEFPWINKIKNLVKEIGWDGIGMFDLISQDEQAYILELNGRFWASIDLSSKTNCNLWENYVLNHLNKDIIHQSPNKTSNAILINLQATCKLLFKDIKQFKFSKQDLKSIACILKSTISQEYTIQESLLADLSFYIHYCFNLIKKKRYPKHHIFVFNFHRISDEHSPAWPPIPTRTFEKIIKYLKKHYDIVPQEQLLQENERQTKTPKCIITVDDAYYDFLENAVPILKKYQCPATLHIVTETVTTGDMFWTQRLNKIVEQYYIEGKSITYQDFSIKRITNDKTAEQTALQVYLKLLENENRNSILDYLEKQLEHPISKTKMLQWKDIDKIPKDLISIGSHTHTHCNLATKSPEDVYCELSKSFIEIKKHLKQEPISIAYPNGQYNETINKIATDIGYKILYTCDNKKNESYSATIYHRFNLYNRQWWKNRIKLTIWHIKNIYL